jgi:hypothetical protein
MQAYVEVGTGFGVEAKADQTSTRNYYMRKTKCLDRQSMFGFEWLCYHLIGYCHRFECLSVLRKSHKDCLALIGLKCLVSLDRIG